MVLTFTDMPEQLTYADLMEFTDGSWETMTDEERDTAYVACVRKVERRCLVSSWKSLCPPGYRNTTSEQLPNVAKFEEVQRWQYGPKGLLVVGPTRRGKTRSVWKLLERLHVNERRKIIAFTPMDLKLAVMSAWQDVETAEDLIFDVLHLTTERPSYVGDNSSSTRFATGREFCVAVWPLADDSLRW
jgi:hypothetical protein